MTAKKVASSAVHVHHTRKGDQREVYEKIVNEGICPFCWENFLRHHPNPILKRGRYWFVTNNAWPYDGTRTHFIFVVKRHITNIDELSAREWGELRTMFAWVKDEYKLPGGSLFIRFGNNEYTGASVTHLHAQVISGGKRKKGAELLWVLLGYKK